MAEQQFTDREKLDCVEREIKHRQRVYRHRVSEGKMRPEFALRQIMLMDAIANDYRGKVNDQLLLPLHQRERVDMSNWDMRA